MADVATISLRVNTGELEKGSQELDKFAGKAGQAALSAGKLNDSQRASFKAFMESASSVSETHRRISEFKARLQETEQSQKKVTKSTTEQRQELQALLQKISPVNKALEDLDSIQSTLSRFSGKGMLASEQFQRYNAILEENRSKLLRVQDAETAEGRAILSAEAALKSQERARTAFIQKLKDQVATQNLSRTELLRYRAEQLGAGSAADVYIRKLKDSAAATHGLGLASAGARREIGILIGEVARGNLGALRGSGITLANRAGWIEQLMTLKGLGIATVVGGIATAVYGLGKAWYEGSQESVEFNKQLILTGNYAGQTASQLQAMAKSLSGHGVTQGDMSRVLAQVIGSGSFRGDQIATVTKAAAAMEEAVGQSVDVTIKNFQKLYSEPTKSSQELNSQIHYLTSSQYEYISSLERRGFKEAAGQEAANAYSKEEQRRAQATIDNMGLIERVLLSASRGWHEFWNAALDIGREQSIDDKIKDIKEKIDKAQAVDSKTVITGFTPLDSFNAQKGKQDSPVVKSLEAQLGLLKSLKIMQDDLSGATAAAKKADDNRTESLEYQNKIISKNMSWQQKRAAALTELWAKVKKAPDAWNQEQREMAVAQINQDFKPPKAESRLKLPKEPAYRDDSATKILQESKKRLAALIEQYGVSQKMTEQEKRLVEFNQQVADLKNKKILTSDQQSILNRADEIRKSLDLEASESRRLENQKKLNDLLDNANKFRRQQEAKRDEISALAKGNTPLEAQRNAEFRRIKEEYAGNPAAQKQALADIRQTYAEMDALNENWRAGVKVGFAEYAREASNAYSQVSRITQNAFQGMSSSLADFLITGKNSFSDFITSTLKGITQMITQMALLNSMKGIFSGTGVGSFLGFADGGLVPSFAAGGYTGNGGKYEPKGVVHGGEFVFTKAQTEAFGVGHLTALARSAGKMPGYANGGFVSGSAPMANIPALRPGYSSGGSSVTVSMGDVVISGGSQQQPSGKAPAGDSIMKQLKPAIVTTISEQANKPGTPLWNAINGKR